MSIEEVVRQQCGSPNPLRMAVRIQEKCVTRAQFGARQRGGGYELPGSLSIPVCTEQLIWVGPGLGSEGAGVSKMDQSCPGRGDQPITGDRQ